MPVHLTYPGVYIEEIPGNNHAVTPAPTSLAVFVGYTHPFKTKVHNKAIRLFSYSDYEREFGGLFSNAVFDAESANFGNIAHAVYQFFLNGGSDCYVVGLQAALHDGGATTAIEHPTADLPLTDGKAITFKGREPTDANHELVVTASNLQKTTSDNDTADIIVSYGTRVEAFRAVTLTDKASKDPLVKARHIENRINGVSQLVTVEPLDAAAIAFDPAVVNPRKEIKLSVSPASGKTIFQPADFNDVFKADSDLDNVPVFNLMVLPGVVHAGVLSAAVAFCERKMAFFIMDPDKATDPVGMSSYLDTRPTSINGAVYFPYLQSFDPATGGAIDVPPSGTVAGIYARTDVRRGVWKAPAGTETTILNTTGVVETGRMNDMRHGVLNERAINCLRTFPNTGTVVYGARTLAAANPAFQDFMYVPVRRMTLFIQQSLLRSLTWATFEPNDGPLWTALRRTVESFMLGLFNNGALQGARASQAFEVFCDGTTTTPDDVTLGVVNIVVKFAPLRPAEFVVAKVGLLAGQAQT